MCNSCQISCRIRRNVLGPDSQSHELCMLFFSKLHVHRRENSIFLCFRVSATFKNTGCSTNPTKKMRVVKQRCAQDHAAHR